MMRFFCFHINAMHVARRKNETTMMTANFISRLSSFVDISLKIDRLLLLKKRGEKFMSALLCNLYIKNRELPAKVAANIMATIFIFYAS